MFGEGQHVLFPVLVTLLSWSIKIINSNQPYFPSHDLQNGHTLRERGAAADIIKHPSHGRGEVIKRLSSLS
jgi:hypothetical protein